MFINHPNLNRSLKVIRNIISYVDFPQLHLATSINVPSRLGSFSKLLDSPESNQEQQTKKCLDKEPPPEKSTCHPFYQRLERNISQEESLEYNFRRPKRKAKEYGNHAPKSIYFQVQVFSSIRNSQGN